MGSNVLTTWGYFFPREIYLQQNTQGRHADAKYIFELSHSDCSYATRIEITNRILTIAQLEFNRIMSTPLQFNRSTSRQPLFAVIVGFSTSVRLNMDVIGDLNDCRQSVVASSMYIVPCTDIQVERHVINRAHARNETFESSSDLNSNFVGTAYRFDTSQTDTQLRLVQNQRQSMDDENENEDEDENGGSNDERPNSDGEGSGNDTDTTPTRQSVARNNRGNQQNQNQQEEDRNNNGSTVNQTRSNRNNRSRSSSIQSQRSVTSGTTPSNNRNTRNTRSRSTSIETHHQSSSSANNNQSGLPNRSRNTSISSAVSSTGSLTGNINSMQLNNDEDENVYSDDSQQRESINRKRKRALVSRRPRGG